MYEGIDVDQLREDLSNEALGIMFNVSKAAVMELSEIEQASPEELIQIAENKGYNLSKYQGRRLMK